MRSQLLTTGVLAMVLVTAGCVGSIADSPNRPQQMTPDNSASTDAPDSRSAVDRSEGNRRTIKVGASGGIRTDPDRAVVRVAVAVTAPDAATARKRLAENVSRMRDALSGMGIGDDQITTTYFDIDRDRHYRSPREREAGEKPDVVFRGRHAFRITLTDLDRTGEVIVTAVESGATSVDNVEFVLSERTRRDLRHQALQEAMTEARAKAETIARSSESLDEGSLTVQSVQTSNVNVRFPERAELMATPTPSAGATTSIDTGSVTVTAQVVVTYNASTS